jgi:hypothetical protein
MPNQRNGTSGQGQSDQAVIAVTGTAVQFNSTNQGNQGINGYIICAHPNNSTKGGTIGWTSSLTNTVDGTGNGFILMPGAMLSIAAIDISDIWVNGTAGDIFSLIGN